MEGINPDVETKLEMSTENLELALKSANRAIQESELTLLEALDIANLGTWELEFATDRIWWNAQTFRIYGMDPTQPPPSMEELLMTVHPEDRGLILTSIQQAKETGEPYKVQRRIFRQDGELRHIITTARIVYDADGTPIRVVGVVQDITEQHIAQAATVKSRDWAVEESRLKSEFLANIGGKIRVSVNGLVGKSEQLLQTDLTPQQEECIHAIRKSTDELASILDQILDFIKLDVAEFAKKSL